MLTDRVTNTVAVASFVSPFWLPRLSEVAQFAGHLLPILGAGWLVIQIIHRLRHWHKKD